MNNDHIDEIIKKAVQDDKEPNFNKMWATISHNINIVEKQQVKEKKKLYRNVWFKIAASISALVIVFVIIGSTVRTGETFPFQFPFHNLVQKVINSTQLLFQFDLKEQDIPDGVAPPPLVDEEITTETGLVDTDIETLKSIYSGTIFYPNMISKEQLQKTEYYNHDFLWVIIMDFKINGSDVVLIQQDTPMTGGSGKSFDKDDTKVSFYRSDGIEYMIAEMRYGIVQITWFMEDKQFDLSTNSTPETTLEIAKSVEPLVDFN